MDDAAEAARRRRAVFGEDVTASADERDDADRVRGDGESAGEQWYREQRPPHHGG